MSNETKPQRASIGRIVHYHFEGPRGMSTRPAIVVQAWGGDDDKVNLRVFYDGANDGELGATDGWATSIPFCDLSAGNVAAGPGTWTWPPRA